MAWARQDTDSMLRELAAMSDFYKRADLAWAEQDTDPVVRQWAVRAKKLRKK